MKNEATGPVPVTNILHSDPMGQQMRNRARSTRHINPSDWPKFLALVESYEAEAASLSKAISLWQEGRPPSHADLIQVIYQERALILAVLDAGEATAAASRAVEDFLEESPKAWMNPPQPRSEIVPHVTFDHHGPTEDDVDFDVLFDPFI